MKIFLLFFLSTLSTPLLASECNTEKRSPAWIFCDDFESGSLDSYQDKSTNGLSISNEQAFRGNLAVKQHYTTGQKAAGWLSYISNQLPDHIFIRWYHFFQSGYETAPAKMLRVQNRNHQGDWSKQFAVHVWATNNLLTLDTYSKFSQQRNASDWLAVATSNYNAIAAENLNRWVYFELEVKLNQSGASDGLFRLWADDKLIIEKLNVDIRGDSNLGFNEVMIDTYFNAGASSPLSRYYDNFVVSSEKIGPIKSAPPKPPQQLFLDKQH